MKCVRCYSTESEYGSQRCLREKEHPPLDHDIGKTNEVSLSFGLPSMIERVFPSKSTTAVHRVWSNGPEKKAEKGVIYAFSQTGESWAFRFLVFIPVMKIGYFVSLSSPRSERNSLLDPVGSIVALFCLLNEFSSCSFTSKRKKLKNNPCWRYICIYC